MNIKKPLLTVKETSVSQPANNATARPKNPPANVMPSDGYILAVDGKFKTEYDTLKSAIKAGLELKTKYPHIRVMAYDAKERSWTLVELPGQSQRKTEATS